MATYGNSSFLLILSHTHVKALIASEPVPSDHSKDITLLLFGYRFRTIKNELRILSMLKSVLPQNSVLEFME